MRSDSNRSGWSNSNASSGARAEALWMRPRSRPTPRRERGVDAAGEQLGLPVAVVLGIQILERDRVRLLVVAEHARGGSGHRGRHVVEPRGLGGAAVERCPPVGLDLQPLQRPLQHERAGRGADEPDVRGHTARQRLRRDHVRRGDEPHALEQRDRLGPRDRQDPQRAPGRRRVAHALVAGCP